MSHSALKTVLASAASATILMIAAQGSAQAGAFGLREQSTIGAGMAFAGVAAGSASLGSMFWNPATVTDLPGMRSEQNFTYVAPYAKLTTEPGSSPGYAALGGRSSGDIGQDGFLPAGYSSYQVNDRLWLGLSSGAPFGLATKPDADWAGRAYGSSTKVSSVEVTPSVAYKINDWLSVGAGLRVLYFHARYTSAVPALAAPQAWNVAGLEGDDTNVGFTLGATLKPWAGGEIGIGYRSMVRETLDGNFFGGQALAPPPFGAMLNHNFKATVNLPETVTVGIRQEINPALTLSGTVEWTNWSRAGFPRIVDQTTGTLHAATPFLPLDYKDGWFFSVGADYRINPAWTVRAGLGYEISPIRDSSRSTRLPDSDRIWTSLGATYNWNEKLAFNLGYTHIFAKSGDVRINAANPNYNPRLAPVFDRLNADGKAHVDIVSLGLSYRWDDVRQTIPVSQPIGRKY